MLRAIPIRPQPVVPGKCAPGKPQALKGVGPGLLVSLGPFSCPYSPECVEGEFSEVRRSKRPTELSRKRPRAAWWHRFLVEPPLPSSVRCSVVYQGVTIRNDATTGEIPAPRTGAD